MLAVPPSAWWGSSLPVLAALNRATARFPPGRALLQAPSRLLGRSMIRMWIDRSILGEGPTKVHIGADTIARLGIHTRVDRPGVGLRGRLRGRRRALRLRQRATTRPVSEHDDHRRARRLRIGRAVRRSDVRLRDRHAVDLTTESAEAHAAPISLPITQTEVHIIASAGFPLWEPLETLQLRNHRITLAYGDLSLQLARLTAGNDDEGEWDANWCTFATWSSRTIGTCIDRQPEHGLIHQLLRHFPAPLRRLLLRALRSSPLPGARSGLPDTGRRKPSGLPRDRHRRQSFSRVFRSGAPTDPANRISRPTGPMCDAFLTGLRHLDPSWLATAPPDPETLRAGMRAYFDAINEPDLKAKAELVLLGNLLLGAYEQTRVEGYLTATLSIFTTSWLHRLMRGPKPGVVAAIGRGLAAPFSTLYACFATRFFLALELPIPRWDDRAHGREARSLVGWLHPRPRLPRGAPPHRPTRVASGPDVLRPLRSTVQPHPIPQLGQLCRPHELHHESLPLTPTGPVPFSASLDTRATGRPPRRHTLRWTTPEKGSIDPSVSTGASAVRVGVLHQWRDEATFGPRGRPCRPRRPPREQPPPHRPALEVGGDHGLAIRSGLRRSFS